MSVICFVEEVVNVSEPEPERIQTKPLLAPDGCSLSSTFSIGQVTRAGAAVAQTLVSFGYPRLTSQRMPAALKLGTRHTSRSTTSRDWDSI